jgi:hypothetical protein
MLLPVEKLRATRRPYQGGAGCVSLGKYLDDWCRALRRPCRSAGDSRPSALSPAEPEDQIPRASNGGGLSGLRDDVHSDTLLIQLSDERHRGAVMVDLRSRKDHGVLLASIATGGNRSSADRPARLIGAPQCDRQGRAKRSAEILELASRHSGGEELRSPDAAMGEYRERLDDEALCHSPHHAVRRVDLSGTDPFNRYRSLQHELLTPPLRRRAHAFLADGNSSDRIIVRNTGDRCQGRSTA